MSKFSTAIKLLMTNRNEFLAQLVKQFAFLFSDKKYLDLTFRYRMGCKINWDNPRTFNEKLNWLKIHDHNPLYTKLVDKESVKSYISSIVGAEYVIPTITMWNSPKEIDFDKLPDQFVLKTTHGGGNDGVVICRDKRVFDKQLAIKKLIKAMKQDLYRDSREWPYKNVEKHIICEPYIEDKKTGELRDYKFFCFDGKVKALFVATERQKRDEPFFNFFDENFNPLPIKQGHPVSPNIPEKPETFDSMKRIASRLSEGFPHVRVDLYEANGNVLFGELTLYHFGAVVPFEPRDWDYKFGEWIKLSNNYE